MYQSVIFDIDGTLLNSDQAILMAFQKALLEETGQEHSIEMLTSFMGMTSVNSLTKLGVPDVAQANAKILQYLRRFFHLMGLYSGIEDMLQQLKKKNVHMGIVTSKTREEFTTDFLPLGINDFFSCVVCADDTSKHKPEAEPLLKYMELTGVNPAKSVYIGDTLYDQQCADAAKIDFALALWGAKQPKITVAKHYLNHPDEILRIMY
ncbi:HAD family hydrolase [Paenibacillus lautus]|uniref:HAD family hydrolase n=1 Tax=Paenibacillus lautus TaxID=1401 RepID=UPI003D2C5794